MAVEVSHGRGGAGNINPDDTKYVDGEVVREGVVGSHGDGVYSAGRGGKPKTISSFFAPSRKKKKIGTKNDEKLTVFLPSLFFFRRRQHWRPGSANY